MDFCQTFNKLHFQAQFIYFLFKVKTKLAKAFPFAS